uniref:RanBP2-type domain-containing protein n=1 Tax=Eutreptiella gymnastica TaxID=73025 RepID=A0A7S1N6U7_9EUGL|mmetsp:Transcript_129419/g.223604  ORF Transcript_129419/g.223604 Transcript_129419/m.223604 type:complete len:334 (+) Transcript_129419:46-1047(+)
MARRRCATCGQPRFTAAPVCPSCTLSAEPPVDARPPKRARHEHSQPLSGGWSCTRCTLDNEATSVRCEACGARPAQAPSVATRDATAGSNPCASVPLAPARDQALEQCPKWRAFAADFGPDHATELARFLSIKVRGCDWDAQVYSPSGPVDAAWCCLLLRPRLYRRVCALLGCPAEEVVDHDPDREADRAEQQRRYAATLGAYRLLFGPPAAALWPPPLGEVPVGPGTGARPSAHVDRDRRTSETVKDAEDPDRQISVKVVHEEFAAVWIKIKRSTPLRNLIDAYCRQQGTCRTSGGFYFDGCRIHNDNDKTAEDYGIKDDDVIYHLPAQEGC